MTWTFDPALSTARDKVRLALGDTDTNDQQIPDESIAAMLAAYGDDVGAASVALAESLAAKYARLASDISVDGASFDYSALVENYRQIATRLRVAGGEGSGALGDPNVSGVSQGDIDSVDANTDRPGNAFRVGSMDAPGT